MKEFSKYVGLDTHKETIAVSMAALSQRLARSPPETSQENNLADTIDRSQHIRSLSDLMQRMKAKPSVYWTTLSTATRQLHPSSPVGRKTRFLRDSACLTCRTTIASVCARPMYWSGSTKRSNAALEWQLYSRMRLPVFGW